MHEIGYCTGVLEAVERRAAGRPVARIGVLVGTLHRISPAAFDQSFKLVAQGTVAAGADTEVRVAPVRATCLACSAAFDADEASPACPRCHGGEMKTEGGDELVLQWVEYVSPDGGSAVREAGGGGNVPWREDH
jgi:hydrogenase nickel incorporation protein HypA/HybF